MQDITAPSFPTQTDKFEEAQVALPSPWKSFLMLCRVWESFKTLEKAGFSSGFFSLLLLMTASPDTAEAVVIRPQILTDIKSALEPLIGQILEDLAIEDSQDL